MSWSQTNVTSLIAVSFLISLWFKEPLADAQGYFPARKREVITFLLREQTLLHICLIYVSGCAACVISQCKIKVLEGMFVYEESL